MQVEIHQLMLFIADRESPISQHSAGGSMEIPTSKHPLEKIRWDPDRAASAMTPEMGKILLEI